MHEALIQEDVVHVCESLRPHFTSFQRRRFFLTGGTGFFGKWLLHTFLGLRNACGLNLSLTVLSRNPRQFLDAHPEFAGHKGLTFVAGDVRTFEFNDLPSFDVVLHGATAASAKLEKEDPEEMYSVITDGTRHVLEFTRRCGAERLLFISSGAVYGPQPPHLSHLSETDEGEPVAAYGKGKKASEKLCLEAADQRFECVIARPFAFVGPYLPLDTHFAIGNFIRDVLAGSPIIINGDGRPYRSYQYAADLAKWLWTIQAIGTNGMAYNIGSDEAVSVLDLALKVRACAGSDAPIVVREKQNPESPPPRYLPSIQRAKAELGVANRYPLDEAIRRTIAWYRNGTTTTG